MGVPLGWLDNDGSERGRSELGGGECYTPQPQTLDYPKVNGWRLTLRGDSLEKATNYGTNTSGVQGFPGIFRYQIVKAHPLIRSHLSHYEMGIMSDQGVGSE